MSETDQTNMSLVDNNWLGVTFAIYHLFIGLVLCSVAIFQILYIPISDLDAPSSYFLIIFYFSCIVLLLSRGKSVNLHFFKKNEIVICIFVILIGSTILKIYYNSWIPIWGDEISQYLLSNSLNPISGAFHQQQPPLGYFFSAWSSKLFEIGQLSIRWPSYSVSALLLLVYFSFLKVFRLRTPIALLSTALLSLMPIVFQFSIESRPILFVMLMALFFLLEVLSLIIHRNFRLIGCIRLVAITILMLLSIGFQPLIFAVVTCFTILVLRFFFRLNAIRVIFSIAVGILIFSPVQVAIKNLSSPYLQSRFFVFEETFSKLCIYLKRSYFLPVPLYVLAFIAVIFLFFSIGFFKLQYFKKYEKFTIKFKDRVIMLSGFLIFFCSANLFMIFAVGIFSGTINWYLADRYLVLGLLNYSLAFAFASELIFSLLENYFNLRDQKKIIICATAYFGFVYMNWVFPSVEKNWYLERLKRFNAIELVVNRIKPKDMFFTVCEAPGCWDYLYIVQYITRMKYDQLPKNIQAPIGNLSSVNFDQKHTAGIYLYIEHFANFKKIASIFPVQPIYSFKNGLLFYFSTDKNVENFVKTSELLRPYMQPNK